MACCNVCYGKCVYGFKVEINTIPTDCPPLFSKRADLAGRGGGQLVGIVLIPRHGPKIPPRKSVHDAVQ